MGNMKRKHKDVPMGLGLVHANAASVTALPVGSAADIPHLRPKRRPNLNGGPQLTLVHSHKQAAAPKPRIQYRPAPSSPKSPIQYRAPTLLKGLGQQSAALLDIADNFTGTCCKETANKVFAAARTLGVSSLPTPRAAGMAGLFAQNAMTIRRSVAVSTSKPAANDMHYAYPAPAFAPRVGGGSVIRAIFGRSPLAGTGYRSYAPATPNRL